MIKNFLKFILAFLLSYLITFILLFIFSLFIVPSPDGTRYLSESHTLILVLSWILTFVLVLSSKARNHLKVGYIKTKDFLIYIFDKISCMILKLNKEQNLTSDTYTNEYEKEILDNNIQLENKKIKSENDELCNKRKGLFNELSNLSDKKRFLTSEVKSLQCQKESLENQIKSLKKDIENQKRELGLLKSNNSDYINELKDYNRDKMEEYLSNLDLEISLKHQVLNSLRKDIKDTQDFMYYQQNKNNNDPLSYLDRMDGIEFEYECAKLLEYDGFTDIVVTQASNDYGIDIFASKSGLKYAIQCKRYSDIVGKDAIQQVYAGKDYYDCDVAVVMTNSYFSNGSAVLANKNNVQLWNREYLKVLYSMQSQYQQV